MSHYFTYRKEIGMMAISVEIEHLEAIVTFPGLFGPMIASLLSSARMCRTHSVK
jgi:hypothetical protein